jgi:hypothetical protein
MAQLIEVDPIRQALQRGALVIPGPDGYQRSLFAPCPEDGHASPVYRTDRSREAIIRVIFRGPVCGRQFDAPPEQMSTK